MSGPRSPEPAPAPDAAAWAAVGLLTFAYILSYVDRTILSLLVGPIRADLGISDTSFSLLNGLAFAIFYTLLGFPLGRWSDRGDRPRIIAGGIAVWSAMTALCGVARGFEGLFAARIGVGAGEAALSPAAYSLIAELFPAAYAGRAFAIYGAGIYLGIGATFMGGGWLVDAMSSAGAIDLPGLGAVSPWRQAFFVVGLPGLMLALAALCWLPEPRRARTEPTAEQRPPILPFLRTSRRFLLLHILGFAALTLAFNGYLAWIPEYFLRSHGWEKARTGLWLGAIVMAFGTAGMLLGGATTDVLRRRGDGRAPMTTACGGALLLLPWPLWATATNDPILSLVGLTPIIFFTAFCFGPAIAALQAATPARLRGQVSALYLFAVNLTGIGLGGTLVALLSDQVFRDEARLGDAMAVVGSAALLLAVPLLWAARAAMPKPVQ